MKKALLSILITSFLLTSPLLALQSRAHEGHFEHEIIVGQIEEVPLGDGDDEYVENSSIDKSNLSTYELFWPVVAGKTRGESLYFLKRFKEKARGWLIFGDAQETKYEIDLATKRLLEAEKLVSNGDNDNAAKTLEAANEHLEEATESWEDVENSEEYKQQIDEMNARLENMRIFLVRWKETQEGEINKKLEEVLSSVDNLDSSI